MKLILPEGCNRGIPRTAAEGGFGEVEVKLLLETSDLDGHPEGYSYFVIVWVLIRMELDGTYL